MLVRAEILATTATKALNPFYSQSYKGSNLKGLLRFRGTVLVVVGWTINIHDHDRICHLLITTTTTTTTHHRTPGHTNGYSWGELFASKSYINWFGGVLKSAQPATLLGNTNVIHPHNVRSKKKLKSYGRVWFSALKCVEIYEWGATWTGDGVRFWFMYLKRPILHVVDSNPPGMQRILKFYFMCECGRRYPGAFHKSIKFYQIFV